MFGLANHDEETRYFLLGAKQAVRNDSVHMLAVIDDCSLLHSGALREEICSEWTCVTVEM